MRVIVIAIGIGLMPLTAQAGAWPQDKGRGQAIVSLEHGSATQGFDAEGDLNVPLDVYEQTDATVYVQYGLTERVTLTAKTGFQSYDTEFESFSGIPAIEVGVRYNLFRSDRSVWSVAASVEGLGDGRRSDVDLSGHEGVDLDLRLLYGRNFELAGRSGYLNVEVAHRERESGPNQLRFDGTVGVRLDNGLTVMGQVFAGQTENGNYRYQGKWVNTQLSVTKSLGEKTFQLGWRQTVAGQYVPAADTLILSLWRDF